MIGLSNRTTYWATERDPTRLAEILREKTGRYFDILETSHWWQVILRNWLYYHNLYFQQGRSFSWTSVRNLLGSNVVGASINEFRATIDLIAQYVTQDRPSFETRAAKADQDALLQAKWGDDILEHYLRDQGLEDNFKRAVIHALVLTEGFVYTPWHDDEGETEFVPELEQFMDEFGELVEQPMRTEDDRPIGSWQSNGDFRCLSPSVLDIVRDLGVREWDHNRWLMVRTRENRWEIAEKVGRRERDQILDMSSIAGNSEREDVFYRLSLIDEWNGEPEDSDVLSVWNFYHLPTPAAPEGVHFRWVGDGIPIGEPEAYPYPDRDCFPVSRVIPSETLLSQLGYSPANDLQAPAELFNAEVSTIASNHKGAGFNAIWKPEGCELKEAQMGKGFYMFNGGVVPPQAIDFNVDSPGRYKWAELLLKSIERTSGMNAVARGEASPDQSGEALKVMEARAVQATTPLKSSYAMAMEQTGTHMLRTLFDRMGEDEERFISILGKNKKWQIGSFQKRDLEQINAVRVDVSNPISRTITGKFEIARMLMEMQGEALTTPEELLSVIETGSLEPLLQANSAQLDLLHDENDRLLDGQSLEADMLDPHILHIREHYAVINSVDARLDQQTYATVVGHIDQHMQFLMNPMVLYSQSLLGYRMPTVPPPIPAGGAPAGGPPGAAPGEAPGPDEAGFEPQPEAPEGM